MAWNNWKNALCNCLKSRTFLGYIICIISLNTNAIAISCIQALDGEIPIFEMTSLRYFAQLLLGLPWQFREGCEQSFSKKYFSMIWVGLFSLANIVANVTMTASPVLIAAGVYTSLMWAVILMIVTLVAVIFFSERRKYIYLAVLLCMAGCLLVTQPFGNEVRKVDENFTGDALTTRHEHIEQDRDSAFTQSTTDKQDTDDDWNVNVSKSNTEREPLVGNSGTVYFIGISVSEVFRRPLGYVLAVVCGMLGSMYVLIQKHTLTNTSVVIVNFWCSAAGTASCAVLSVATENIMWPSSWTSSALLLGYMIGYGGSAILNLVACDVMDAVIVTLMLSLEIIVSFTLQYTVLASIRPGRRNWEEVTGAAFILIANIIEPAVLLYQKHKATTDVENKDTEKTPLTEATTATKNEINKFDQFSQK